MVMKTVLVLLVTWCAVASAGTDYYSLLRRMLGQEETNLTCRQKVAKALEEERGNPPMDREFPKCDEYGNYKVKQCFGGWTGRGHCGCVNAKSGKHLTDIKGVTYREGWRMTCRCAQDHKEASERMAYCDTNTGDYKPVFCMGNSCMCAERWGAPMFGFGYFTKGRSNCMCARKLSDVGDMVGATYNCQDNGQYQPQQCMGSQCFCVDKEGVQVGESVNRGETDRLNCQ